MIVEAKIWRPGGDQLTDVMRTADGMWQFVGPDDPDAAPATEADFVVVDLSKVLKRWPTVEQLSDLRPGHGASWCGNHGWEVSELNEDDDDLPPQETWRTDDDGLREQLRQRIDEYGFCVQQVFPKPDDDRQEWFSYTIGLTDRRHPELVVYNLAPEAAAAMLDYLGDRVLEGSRYDAGTSTTEVNRHGHPVRFIQVDDPADLTLLDLVYHEYDAVQLVHPDRKGRFPWNAGYRVDKKMPQRLVGTPPVS